MFVEIKVRNASAKAAIAIDLVENFWIFTFESYLILVISGTPLRGAIITSSPYSH